MREGTKGISCIIMCKIPDLQQQRSLLEVEVQSLFRDPNEIDIHINLHVHCTVHVHVHVYNHNCMTDIKSSFQIKLFSIQLHVQVIITCILNRVMANYYILHVHVHTVHVNKKSPYSTVITQ